MYQQLLCLYQTAQLLLSRDVADSAVTHACGSFNTKKQLGSNSPPLVFGGGPRLAPLPQDDLEIGIASEYAEHGFIGDAIHLRWSDGNIYGAAQKPLEMPNTLSLTYGAITGLAGDYYGTVNPISNKDVMLAQQKRFFLDAWGTLAKDKERQPGEAHEILGILKGEVDAVNDAINRGEEASAAYASISDNWEAFQDITWDRGDNFPSFLGLAQINFDHFGEDARTAYNVGHLVALEHAARGGPDDLSLAYTMNAFADHFLQDSFSAGHLRTPRHELHEDKGLADLCARRMHDEDNAIGLRVQNPMGDSFIAYGDKRLLDRENHKNLNLTIQAAQASADEVFAAWKSKTVISFDNFTAWEFAPTLASARGAQELAPLFLSGKGPPRRDTLANRREWKYTNYYTFGGTLFKIGLGKLWNYPIKLDPK